MRGARIQVLHRIDADALEFAEHIADREPLMSRKLGAVDSIAVDANAVFRTEVFDRPAIAFDLTDASMASRHGIVREHAIAFGRTPDDQIGTIHEHSDRDGLRRNVDGKLRGHGSYGEPLSRPIRKRSASA